MRVHKSNERFKVVADSVNAMEVQLKTPKPPIPLGDRENLANQMHRATRALNERKVRDLLVAGVPADVWGLDEDDDLPLQVAARFDSDAAVSIAEALIAAGATVDFQGHHGRTALARAVEACDGSDRAGWAMARFLVGAGADISIANRDGLCPAEAAICNSYQGAVQAMLDAGMPPNARGVAGPLLWYCAWDDPQLVKELLARGAPPDEKSYGLGHEPQTPLQRAVEAFEAGGSSATTLAAIAIALIEAGADPRRIQPAPECLRAFLLSRQEKAAFSDLPAGADDGPGALRPL